MGKKKKKISLKIVTVFLQLTFTVSGLLMVYLWVVIINEVQVDSQLPHTFEGLSELQAV